ncbi:chemotaxis protein CheW [Clostridium estertheticum]|uniref:chemotaxis protein CheW n=1 Tax=Clostridium estertheticum TaxID=238834 RepID=UPI001CF1009E|nr:chemotaxis protein CheW [Clostridium estertheticum]MCB2306208.1 chemotaxis protein CheW [Clostridium estertheticum]MCB2344381.1 chemotaxis protein CheW [Clostridium estertheticum]MCB2349300.1 chemotaxis protein CheW [Clostridium estertheticum]WAG45044.1 chemotaxis protein CheW [Clostridium estertheticum]
MAVKIVKKNSDNFEKMKREMTAKKQQAKMKQEQVNLQTDIENKDCLMQKQDQCIKTVMETIIDVKKIEVIVFKVDEEEFALRISYVKEIIRVPILQKIPNTPQYITGLCSLRGDLLPVIDSRKLFNMPHKEFDDCSRIIVTDIHDKRSGLICDKVSEVITVEESAIKEPPSSIKGIDGGVINSILILNNGKRVVMLLDAEKITKVYDLYDVAKEQHRSADNLEAKEEEQIIIFNIGLGEYGFNINYVKEIIRLPAIMKVPNTPSFIEGVFSIRNQIISVVNLGKLLGMDFKQPDENSRVVIINNGSFSFGVIVDKVSHVMVVANRLFKKSNEITNSFYVKGIYNLNKGKRLIIMLEPLKLISYEEARGVAGIDLKENVNDKSLNVSDEDNNFEHIVIFKLDEEEYGIKIRNVQEINRMSEITHIPGAPVFINGMVNLRGDIIPILNLRKLFTVHDSGSYSESKFLVVEFENMKIGIIIDSASEVLKFSKKYIEEASEVFDGNNSYIDKIAKLNNGKRVVLILNLKTVLSFM